MQKTKLLSIGDQVQPGTYEIHSRFERVVNYVNGRKLISLVEKEVGAGPINIMIKGLRLDGIHAIEIEAQAVLVGRQKYDFGVDHIFHSPIDFEGSSIDTFRKNLAILKQRLLKTSHPKSLAFILDERRVQHFHSKFEKAFVKRVLEGVQSMHAGEVIRGVKRLHGCGFGLTPSGDDFIAGLLIGFHCIQKMFNQDLIKLISEVYEACSGGNIFSRTFLYLAKEGLLFERVQKLMAAISASSAREVRVRTEHLLSVGETSGADLATGLLVAFAKLPVIERL